MPIIYISSIRSFFNDPPWISFTPFSHFFEIELFLKYKKKSFNNKYDKIYF